MGRGEGWTLPLAWWHALWHGRPDTPERTDTGTALIPLPCHVCHRTIQPGEPLRRLTLPTYVYYRPPVCCTCHSSAPMVQ